MRWAEANVNLMLALRLLLCNQRWDAGWQDIHQQQQQQKRQTQLDKISLEQSSQPPDTLSQADLEQLITTAEKLQKKQKPPTPKEEHPWRNDKWPLRYQ